MIGPLGQRMAQTVDPSWIDPYILDVINRINSLGYIHTTHSCAGIGPRAYIEGGGDHILDEIASAYLVFEVDLPNMEAAELLSKLSTICVYGFESPEQILSTMYEWHANSNKYRYVWRPFNLDQDVTRQEVEMAWNKLRQII